MKLLCEALESDLELLVEQNEEGEKLTFIEGIFMQADVVNRNRRRYKKNILESAVDKYINEQVRTNRAVGELDHPPSPTVSMKEASHRIVDLRWEGNNVVGKALILDTPNGNTVKGLLKGGVQLGVSSRGMGSLMQQEDFSDVGEDFFLNTIDIVQDPSAQNAFVNGLMESTEWYLNPEGVYVAKSIEENVETERAISEDRMIEAMERFLSEISR